MMTHNGTQSLPQRRKTSIWNAAELISVRVHRMSMETSMRRLRDDAVARCPSIRKILHDSLISGCAHKTDNKAVAFC
jgi:hypothetical protein